MLEGLDGAQGEVFGSHVHTAQHSTLDTYVMRLKVSLSTYVPGILRVRGLLSGWLGLEVISLS